jgi:hypothetical protein
VSGTTVHFTAAGTCVVDANQAGNARYAAAPQVQQTVKVIRVPRRFYGSGSGGAGE